MRKSLPRPKGLPTRIQLLVDLAGGFARMIELTKQSRTALGGWARGVREPHPTQLHHLAETCGIDLHWLKTGDGIPPVRLNPGMGLPTPPPIQAAELAPTIDLLGTVDVAAIGPVTVATLGHDWASGLGLGRGAISILCADETAAPFICMEEPVLLARMADWKSALPLHPDGIWAVEVEGKILLRKIILHGQTAELLPVGNKRTARIRLSPDSLVVRGRAVWTGVRL